MVQQRGSGGRLGKETTVMDVQWNLSTTDTFGTNIIVLISEVSLFQGENIIGIYVKLGLS